MTQRDPDKLPPDFEERFFARQRAEIAARLTAAPQVRSAPRRRAARLAAPLAAVLVGIAVLAGWFALRGPVSPAVDAGDWLFAWELPAEDDADDPLAAFDPESEVAETGDLVPVVPFLLPSFEELSGQDATVSDDLPLS